MTKGIFSVLKQACNTGLFRVLMVCAIAAGGIAAQEGEADAAQEVEAAAADTPASEADQGPIHAGNIIITATRGDKSVSDAPGAVTVISQEQIEARPSTSLNSLLSGIPGFTIRGGSGDFTAAVPNIVLRGFSGTRTQVMVDGIPLNNPRSAEPQLYGIAAQSVEQIEAVKGPMSALYGSGMGGIINVLTKMPEKSELVVDVGYGNPFVEGQGNKNVINLYGSYGNKLFNSFSFLVDFNRRSTDGFSNQWQISTYPGAKAKPTATAAGADTFIVGDKGDQSFLYQGFMVKTRHDIMPNAYIGISYYRHDFTYDYGVPHDLDGNVVYGRTDEFDHSVYPIQYPSAYSRDIINGEAGALFFDKLSVKLSSAYINGDYYFLTPNSAATTGFSHGPGYSTEAPTKSYLADLLFQAPFFYQNLTLGVSFKSDTMEYKQVDLSYWRDRTSVSGLHAGTNTLNGGTNTLWAVYLQDEINIMENLAVYVGARFDWWKVSDGYTQEVKASNSIQPMKHYASRDKWSISPKLSVVYSPLEITTIRASGGHVFNAPNLYQLFSTYSSLNGTVHPANPDLDPETAWSWDFRVTQDIIESLQVSAGYFENYISDMISSGAYITKDDVTFSRANVAEAVSRGIELELSYSPFEFITLSADYTWTYAHITKDDSNAKNEDKVMQHVPAHVFNAGIEGRYKKLRGFLGASYISKRYNTSDNTDTESGVSGSYDPRFLLDSKFSFLFNEHFTASAAINNILNTRFYESVYLNPGTSWAFSVTAKY